MGTEVLGNQTWLSHFEKRCDQRHFAWCRGVVRLVELAGESVVWLSFASTLALSNIGIGPL